ncbi:hypothetical protein JYT31_00870 [Beggiatoa alba]|nr:hypothetical protein [Beggiatoa alba]
MSILQKNKKFSACRLSLVVFVFMLVACTDPEQPVQGSSNQPDHTTLSIQVKAVLDSKVKLIETLVRNPIVIDAIRAANRERQHIAMSEIQHLDKKWRSVKGSDAFIKSFMNNACAGQLIQFQKKHAGFPEVFIAGARGMNVCQTNKTTDYYQADEAWWVNAFDGGKGRAHYVGLEYDESARSVSVPVYVPVRDPESGLTIGVCKAIVDVSQIKHEL